MRKYHVRFTEKKSFGQHRIGTPGSVRHKTWPPHDAQAGHLSCERPQGTGFGSPRHHDALAMGLVSGAKHMSHPAPLRADAGIRALFTGKNFSDDTAFGRTTLDPDSPVKSVYGSRQGAEKGFNSRKKGLNSYRPALFEDRSSLPRLR
jgi:hypothetical protein